MKHINRQMVAQATQVFSSISKKGHTVSLEEEVKDGKIFREHEHVFYVKLKDFMELNGAASVDAQEQWNIKVKKNELNAAGGSVRIRKVTPLHSYQNQLPKGLPEFVMTTKAEMPDGARMEVPIPTTEDAFKVFTAICDSGMIKHRYHFPVAGGLTFEVDAYPNPEGGYHPWVKIDLEVYDITDDTPPLPFTYDEMIRGDTNKPLEKEKISDLYDKYFITKNPNGPKLTQEGFVSAIFSFFKKKKKEGGKPDQKIDATEHLYDWLKKHVSNGVLNPDLQIKTGVITVDKSASFALYRGEKAFSAVSEVLAEYRKDLSQYKSIFQQYQHSLVTARKVLSEFHAKAFALIDTEEKRNAFKEEDLVKLVLTYSAKMPEPIIKSFREPSYEFIGNYETGFTSKSASTGVIGFGNGESIVKNVNAVAIATPTMADIAKVVAMAKEIGQFDNVLYELSDGFPAVDGTDPPFRALEEAYKDDDFVKKLDPLLHPVMDEMYRGLADELTNRVSNLEYGLWALVRASTTLAK